MIRVKQSINPRTGFWDKTIDPNSIVMPDGIPAAWDASSGNFPTVVAGTPDWWVIEVAGTLPAPVWAVLPQDFIIYNGTSWTVIHAIVVPQTIPSNELYINVNEPEVLGKQYQSVENAHTYLASLPTPPAENTNPRTIRFAGYIAEHITTMSGVSYVGEWIDATILESVMLSGEPNGRSSIYNARVNDLGMSNINITTEAVSIVSNITVEKHWSFYTGTPPGFTSEISISTPNCIDVVYLTWNGTLTINELITNRNANTDQPSYFMQLDQWDGTQILGDWDECEIAGWIPQTYHISFSAIPTSGVWIIQYIGQTPWCTAPFDETSTAQSIQDALRTMASDVNTAEWVYLGDDRIIVEWDYSSGFDIKFEGIFESFVNIQVPEITKAYCFAQLPGMTSYVKLEAQNYGGDGNIAFRGDGVKTIQQLLNDWNNANPSNTIAPLFGDLSQVPNNGERFIFQYGIDQNVMHESAGDGVYWYINNCSVLANSFSSASLCDLIIDNSEVAGTLRWLGRYQFNDSSLHWVENYGIDWYIRHCRWVYCTLEENMYLETFACSEININDFVWTRAYKGIHDIDNKEWNGDPTWGVVPTRVLQHYINKDDGTVYISTGLSSTDRKQLWTFTP